MSAPWRPVGEIVLLQIQRRALTGGRPNVYRPEPLLEVDALAIEPGGVSAEVDGRIELDVHHREHPDGAGFTPDRALSIGFTAHYAAMAERFGSAPIGIAGENVIVASGQVLTQPELAGGIRVEHADGTVTELDRAKVAAPCPMFTRHLRGTPDATIEEIAEDRAFLHRGMRGFVLRLDHRADRVVVRAGDRVSVRAAG